MGVLIALAGAAAAQSEDPNPQAPRWADADYEVSVAEDLSAIQLDGQIDVHKIQTSDRMLQRHCGGSTCSADDLREAYQRAGDSGKQRIVDEMESRVENRVAGALAGLGASNTNSSADVDEASLAEPTEGSEYQPPIPIDATGSGELSFVEDAGVSSEQVEALFEMGARVDQDVQVDVEPGTNLTLSLVVPSPLNVLDAQRGEIAQDGSRATWVETNWKGESASSIEDQVTIGDPSVEIPDQTDARVEVTLDISNVSVVYGSLLGDGQPAEADVAVVVDGQFTAIENPRNVSRVQLDYLSADAVRIALDAGLLDTRQLISLEDRARSQIRGTFESLTGEPADVTGGFAADDLSPTAIGDPPGTGGPIEMRLNASETVPFPPQQSAGAAAQGFTVTTLSMGTLDLPQIDPPYDVETSITVVLPQGLDLDFQSPEGYTVEEHTQDGRQAYTFSSTDEGSGTGDGAAIQNAEVVVNHPFVWDVFWPLLVTLVLLLVVLPAVIIGLTIRRRRKYGPPTASESTTPVSGSQATERTETGDEG